MKYSKGDEYDSLCLSIKAIVADAAYIFLVNSVSVNFRNGI